MLQFAPVIANQKNLLGKGHVPAGRRRHEGGKVNQGYLEYLKTQNAIVSPIIADRTNWRRRRLFSKFLVNHILVMWLGEYVVTPWKRILTASDTTSSCSTSWLPCRFGGRVSIFTPCSNIASCMHATLMSSAHIDPKIWNSFEIHPKLTLFVCLFVWSRDQKLTSWLQCQFGCKVTIFTPCSNIASCMHETLMSPAHIDPKIRNSFEINPNWVCSFVCLFDLEIKNQLLDFHVNLDVRWHPAASLQVACMQVCCPFTTLMWNE